MKKLAFGVMRMPLLDKADSASFDYEQIYKMVDLFIEKGFSHFDTANGYHGGASQGMIKKALVSRHAREKYVLSTKLPPWSVSEAGDMEKIFNSQLEACGVEYFDYYLLHALNRNYYKDVIEKFDAFGFVQERKSAGKIKQVGFSFHDTPEILEDILKKHHKQTDFIMLQINYLDWEHPGVQAKKCYDIARAYNIPIMVMEPVKGGTLANVPKEVDDLFKAHDKNLSPASYAVRFAAGLDGVFSVLSGMSSLEQVSDNVSYMQDFKPLDKKESALIAKAREIIESKVAIRCTYCGYCEDDCPKNIAIAGYFGLYNTLKAGDANPFNQRMYYSALAEQKGKPSECIKCKKCEVVCPQKLEVIKHLGEVDKEFK
ncbi:MAG: aldo/keto reductase [Firmicutes bacterium]|nr:aldo/keto reductase [Bacillota bacterium]